MTDTTPRVLVYGYGNPGRLDDGLGPALAEHVAREELPGVTVETNYQLAVEDAAIVADHDVVVFADASMEGPDPFTFRRLEPRSDACFTTHVLPPDVLMGIAAEHFGAEADGFLLGIRGHDFDEFGEYLSDRARDNLGAAVSFLLEAVRSGRFEERVTANAMGASGDRCARCTESADAPGPARSEEESTPLRVGDDEGRRPGGVQRPSNAAAVSRRAQ